MAQVIRSPKTYDVCIIGSGAAGGTAAKILTEGGLNVVMLEAGPPLNPEKDFKEHVWPYQLPHRGAGVGGRASADFGEFLAPNGSWEIDGEPYTVAPGLALPLVPLAHCWRTHQSLGPHRAAFCSGRFQGPLKRRHGRRLADQLTTMSRRTTTKLNPSSAFSARKKMFPARPTAFS